MEPVNIFISYSHLDLPYYNQLITHISSLTSKGYINHWSDHKIIPGNNWSEEISTELNKADIIILLISPDSLSSEYCRKEFQLALQKHKKRKL